MRSLNAHLTEAASHGHLPYHPGCPVCRAERLAGRVAREPILSRRAQASLLAAVLAFSTGGPSAALAAEPPPPEGATPVEGKAPDEDEGDFDPGDEVPLPNEVTQPPPVPGGDDDNPAGPVEGEPQEQVGSQTGAPAGQAPGSQGAPPPNVPAQPAPPAHAPAPQGVQGPAAPPQATPDARAERPEGKRKQPRRPAAPPDRRLASSPPATTTPRQRPALATTPAADATATPTPAPSTTTSTAAGPAIPAGADTYTVRSGDSLWSIAKAQLGGGASPARIAREVDRLWTLNAERIGTGDPGLIMPGQTLRLR